MRKTSQIVDRSTFENGFINNGGAANKHIMVVSKPSQLDDLFTQVLKMEDQYASRVEEVSNVEQKVLECAEECSEVLTEIDTVSELVSEQLELKADALSQLILLRVETSTLKKYIQTIEDEIQTLNAEHVKLKARRAAQHQKLSTQVVRVTELSSTICSEEMQQRKKTSMTKLRSDIQQQLYQYDALDQHLQQVQNLTRALAEAKKGRDAAALHHADADSDLERQLYGNQLVVKRALVSWRRLEKVQAGLESLDAENNQYIASSLVMIRNAVQLASRRLSAYSTV